MTRNLQLTQLSQRWLTGLVLLGACVTSVPAYAQAVLTGKDDWLFYAQDNISDAGKASIDNSIALMRAARENLAKQGVGLVVLVAPLKARFYEDKLPAGKSISPAVKDRYANIIAGLKQADIKTVDLMPVLKSVEHDEQTAFLQKDSHWTAWSAEAAAKATAPIITQNWKLGGQAGTGTKLGPWIKERRFGDFAELMTAAQRKALGQQIYVVRENKAAAGGLLDDGAAPVHVVGNSFVQPYLGFPQTLSNAIDRPVGLTWKYGNFGPWAGFLDYLKSPSFQQNRPQVIVWQLNEAQMLYGPNTSGQWDAASLMPDNVWRERVSAAVSK